MTARPAHRLTTLLVAVLVAVLVIGGTSAYAVGRLRSSASAAEDGTSPGDSSPPDSPPPVASTDSTPPSPTRTTDSPTAPAQPGPVSVDLSPSAEASSSAREVKDMLSRYFTAINHHDYDAWLTTVTTSQATRDRESWEADYQSTQDSDIYVSDIDPAADVAPDTAASLPDGALAVRMQFVSHQSVALAPTALPKSCVRWDVTYFVVDEGLGLRVGNSVKQPAVATCP